MENSRKPQAQNIEILVIIEKLKRDSSNHAWKREGIPLQRLIESSVSIEKKP